MTPNLESIWNEFSDNLARFIRVRVNDPAAAEDIRQDVFLKVQKQLVKLRDFDKIESWVYRIARNAVVDHYRARRETTEVSETLPEPPPADDAPLSGLRVVLRRMVDDLPEPYREAVVLTELEGLTQKELADRLGISHSGAKSRVQRGRMQLKESLLECCRFEFDRRGGMIDCEPHHGTRCAECD
jgi:RNA polymerase sigma-70 factor (ECF subfamily)